MDGPYSVNNDFQLPVSFTTPRYVQLSVPLDIRVAVFAIAIAGLAALAFSLGPALGLVGVGGHDPEADLVADDDRRRGSGGGGRSALWRRLSYW